MAETTEASTGYAGEVWLSTDDTTGNLAELVEVVSFSLPSDTAERVGEPKPRMTMRANRKGTPRSVFSFSASASRETFRQSSDDDASNSSSLAASRRATDDAGASAFSARRPGDGARRSPGFAGASFGTNPASSMRRRRVFVNGASRISRTYRAFRPDLRGPRGGVRSTARAPRACRTDEEGVLGAFWPTSQLRFAGLAFRKLSTAPTASPASSDLAASVGRRCLTPTR